MYESFSGDARSVFERADALPEVGGQKAEYRQFGERTLWTLPGIRVRSSSSPGARCKSRTSDGPIIETRVSGLTINDTEKTNPLEYLDQLHI